MTDGGAGASTTTGAGGAVPFTHVRVLCLDQDGCLLLMRWRDPVDGHDTWEPPGGQVEAGESLLQAAARELREEAGIDAVLRDRYVVVHRDDRWKGVPRVRDEAVFFAAVGDAEVRPDMPTDEEASTLVEWRFVPPGKLDRLGAPVYPDDPFALLTQLLG
ncbi:MAG: NUDIX hydrolase [Actinomycetota bacterium]|nr:NUDIX hydrolase [Actinomycetota bacterium]